MALIGGLPKPAPLNARAPGVTPGDRFRIRKALESQPNFPVTALHYIPDRLASDRSTPGIPMMPPATLSGKASDAGMAALFARNGSIVLSYDPIA